MLTDLAAQVGNPVIVYIRGSTAAYMGVLASCDPTGVTKWSNDDSFSTTHYEFSSSEIAGFATVTTD